MSTAARPRRILLLSHYALPHLGGIEVVVDATARELTRRGHDVTHLACDAVTAGTPGPSGTSPADAPGAPATDYRVVRLPALNVLETRLGVPYPIFGPPLFRAPRAEVARADVVHAHGFLYMTSALGLALARGRAVRVLSEHVGHVDYGAALDRVESAAIATLGRATARSAQALVTMNPKVASELRALAPGRPVELIANGVDTDAYRPAASPEERAALRSGLGWDDGVPRALFVGRLVAKKGVDAALAAAAAGAGAFRLVLVGPGRPPREPQPHAEFLGPVPPARVAELMRAADAFLLPSRGEGFPVTVQEAMASGLPAVLAEDPAYAAHLAGAAEGVRLVAPDGEALAAAVRALLASPGAAAAAAGHARQAFSWTVAIDAHEALYERLARVSSA